jgi:DNA-binding response OmpR family regulator
MANKILVVDDDTTITEFVKKGLERAGYEVAVACDGDEALLKVAEESPEVILLDLVMPKRNGFEVLAEIRKRYPDPWIPVIIISANNELETVNQSYRMEADHYLTKPCTMENILRGIRIMLGLRAVRLPGKGV